MKTASSIVFLSFLLCSAFAAAQSQGVFLDRYEESTLNLDGELDDWSMAGYDEQYLAGDDVVAGKDAWGGKKDMSLAVTMVYDDSSLIIGLEATDDKHVRTKKFEPDEDHVEFWIQLPPEAEGEPGEIKVITYYPGRMFPTFKGGVRWLDRKKGKTKAVNGAKFYEKSDKSGWEAELIIPWKSMPGVWENLPQTKWAIVAVDCDNFHVRTRETILATGWSGSEPKLKRPDVEEVENVAGMFKEQVAKDVLASKRYYANVAGDGRVEVIVEAGKNYGIFGHGFKFGVGYVYISLPVESVADIASFELRDLDGDGRSEMIFAYRQVQEGWERKMLAVYGFRSDDAHRMFAQETERKSGGKSAKSSVEIMEGALDGKTLIKVSSGAVKGWTKTTFMETTEMDVKGVVLPWEEEKTKYYVCRAGAFEKEDTAAVEEYLAKPQKKKGKKKKGKGKGKK
ncbi:MAG: hypothetical protein ABIJ56_05475 [Pseudomonadota bacterium]